MKTLKTAITLLILLIGLGADVTAATHSQPFRNDYDTNRIWLWAVEPTTQFTNLTFDNAPVSNWLATVNSGDRLFFESDDGSTIAPSAGLFTVDFGYTTPTFSIEWAEIFWDGATNGLLGSGTLTWNGSGWSGSSVFTHAGELATAPVPLPASFTFLISGVLLGAGFAHRPARTV